MIETQTLKNKFLFIREGDGNRLELVTTVEAPEILLRSGKKKAELTEKTIALAAEVEVTGWKTVGTRIAENDLREIVLLNQPDSRSEAAAPTLF